MKFIVSLFIINNKVYSPFRSSGNTCLHKNNPSHRILRLCDFMSQFDCEDVKFVRVVDAAVLNLFIETHFSVLMTVFVFQQTPAQETW